MPIDESELVRLIMQRRAMVLAYVRAIVADADLAEDVFQDVVVVALKKRDQLATTENLGAWFRKIARYESLNALRRRHRRPTLFDDRLLDLVDATWNQLDERGEDDRVEAIQDCVERLPEKSRSLLAMKYDQGLSGQELAEKLDRPLNTIYVTLSRIHTRLRECIQRHLLRQHHTE